jgi:hypothetical protein
MARFILVASMYGTPDRGQPQVLPRGTCIASDAGSALVGDVVYTAICNAPSPAMQAIGANTSVLQAKADLAAAGTGMAVGGPNG